MVLAKKNQLYDAVIDVTQDYLGPAAGRFIDRSITNHLKKKPEDLTASDLKKLVDWVKVSVAVLTEDSDLVAEYIARLSNVGRMPKDQR